MSKDAASPLSSTLLSPTLLLCNRGQLFKESPRCSATSFTPALLSRFLGEISPGSVSTWDDGRRERCSQLFLSRLAGDLCHQAVSLAATLCFEDTSTEWGTSSAVVWKERSQRNNVGWDGQRHTLITLALRDCCF